MQVTFHNLPKFLYIMNQVINANSPKKQILRKANQVQTSWYWKIRVRTFPSTLNVFLGPAIKTWSIHEFSWPYLAVLKYSLQLCFSHKQADEQLKPHIGKKVAIKMNHTCSTLEGTSGGTVVGEDVLGTAMLWLWEKSGWLGFCVWNNWSCCSSCWRCSCCLKLVLVIGVDIFLIGSTRFSSTPRADKSWLFLRELE